MLKEILESVMNEGKITVKDFEKLLDKYEYGYDPEEIAFAFDRDDFATMTIEDIVDELNKEHMTLKEVEKILKNALN